MNIREILKIGDIYMLFKNYKFLTFVLMFFSIAPQAKAVNKEEPAKNREKNRQENFIASLLQFANREKYTDRSNIYFQDIIKDLDNDDYSSALYNLIPILSHVGNLGTVAENKKFIKYLLDNGANINQLYSLGRNGDSKTKVTIITVAALHNYKGKGNNTIEALLDLGANPFKKNYDGKNALQYIGQDLQTNPYYQAGYDFLAEKMEEMKRTV
jgi:hypothetical protein